MFRHCKAFTTGYLYKCSCSSEACENNENIYIIHVYYTILIVNYGKVHIVYSDCYSFGYMYFKMFLSYVILYSGNVTPHYTSENVS